MMSNIVDVDNTPENLVVDMPLEVTFVERGDVMLHAAPVSHASGSYFLPHLVRGATSVLLPRSRENIDRLLALPNCTYRRR